jgi:hypothetical protein
MKYGLRMEKRGMNRLLCANAVLQSSDIASG